MMASARIKRQQGTVLIWMVTLSFIVAMAALVVDAGRLYFDQKNLQSAANTLASRLAEEGQTCSGAIGGTDVGARAAAELNAMMSANEAPANSQVSYAELVLIEVPDGEENITYSVTQVNNADRSNGVSVSLQKPVSGLLSFAVERPLTAEASVRKELVIGASISSEVLSLDTSQSDLLGLVFGNILGQNVTLDGVGLTQLNNALTDVGDLVDGLGLASAVNAIPVDTLLLGVLDASEGVTGAAGAVVQELVDAAVDSNISVDDVLKGVHEASVPPGSKVSTLGLVQSIILNVDNALPKNITLSLSDLGGVAGLGSLLSGLADISVNLSITPSPGFFIAAARRDAQGNWPRATSSAITADIVVRTGLGPIRLVDIILGVETARASVELIGTDCASGDNNVIPNIAILGDADLVALTADIDLLDVAGLVGVSVDLDSQQTLAGSINADFNNIDMSFYNDSSPKEFRVFDGTGMGLSGLLNGLINSANVCVEVLFIPICLGPTVNAILGPLVSILSGVLDDLVAPLLEALGIALVPSQLTLESVGQSYTLIEQGIQAQ